jgi:hypothetical protein
MHSMSSAEHVHTTDRRTLLAQAGVAAVIGVTAKTAASATPEPSEVACLIRQWHDAVGAWRIEARIDEDSEATEAKRRVWGDLEDRIFRTPARSLDDLRLKVEFYRREDPFDDDDWLEGIFADIDRLSSMGGLA